MERKKGQNDFVYLSIKFLFEILHFFFLKLQIYMYVSSFIFTFVITAIIQLQNYKICGEILIDRQTDRFLHAHFLGLMRYNCQIYIMIIKKPKNLLLYPPE